MLLIGIAERLSPDRFHMSDVMENVVSSWPSLCLWTILTVLEYVGKCVPVIDQIVDGVEAFIVPVLSTLATSSTFGTYGSNDNYNENDNGNNSNNNIYNEGNNNNNENNERNLTSTHSLSTVIQTFFQITIIFTGILLALSLHFFKMLVRLLGVGCLTPFLTVVEATTVVTGVLISVFVRKLAIVFAGCMLLAAGYNAKRRYEKWEERHKGDDDERQLQQHQHQQCEVSGSGDALSGGHHGRAITTEYEQMKDEPVIENSGSAHV
eukprot:CAMPEP_0171390988 /NCGR_PEP_ID=MMETSP0880-20121228/947_1 /TAXON_ID=67004 /ORGANISM="Thalassiosira weissflogii, Strain CCMP1336" /LENGTH=264 /DNA_ID=CAMNT_0011903527 /DNA_START=193 /DNA_END=987 /DNA_ORIENTATION=+